MTDRPRAIVVSPYTTEYGPSRVLEHVVRALAARGYEPICVVPPRARLTKSLETLSPAVVPVQQLSTVPRTADPSRLARFLRAHMNVAHEIEQIATSRDAVAVWSIGEATFAGSIAARRLRIPSLVHVIGMSIKSPRVGASVYIRFLGELTDTFVACSSAVAEMLAGFGVPEDRIVVVHNGVPTSEVALAAREPIELPDGGPAIGMVAAFDPRKGHELFVDAAATIYAERPKTRFFIVGGVLERQPESVEFERRIRRRIEEHGLERVMTITGYVPSNEAYRWVSAMDVVVVPSKTEAFAHALVEAMACGKPVVASGIEGNLDAFVDGHSGIFVDRSRKEVAAAVCKLLDDDTRAAAIGAAARRHAQLLFDESVTLPALAAAVDDLVSRPAA